MTQADMTFALEQALRKIPCYDHLSRMDQNYIQVALIEMYEQGVGDAVARVMTVPVDQVFRRITR